MSSPHLSDFGTAPIIDDGNYQQFIDVRLADGTMGMRGREPRDYTKQPLGSLGFASPFTQVVKEIPQSEWQARIQEQEEKGELVDKICDARGSKVKYQAQTNFCWGNSPIRSIEVARCVAGQPIVSLSPASVCCKINGFRNAGGWGSQAVDYCAKVGPAPSSDWPDNAIDRQYDNAKSDADRPKYKIADWVELEPHNLTQLGTLLLKKIPVCLGLDWWGHEILAIRLLWNRGFYVLIDNSWGTQWGDNGRGVLTLQKASASDAVAPLYAMAG